MSDNGRSLPIPEVVDRGFMLNMHLGSEWVQGSVLVDAPNVLVHEYVQRMMAGLLFVDLSTIERSQAMQLGLGAGSLSRFCLNVVGMRTVAVELNPHVVEVCRTVFALPVRHRRLRVLLDDATNVVNDPYWGGAVDLLHVDVYNADATAPALDSAEFYAACARTLTPQGVMTVNVFGSASDPDGTVARLAPNFENGTLGLFYPTTGSNVVIVATRQDPPPPHVLEARAEEIETRWGLPAHEWVRELHVQW